MLTSFFSYGLQTLAFVTPISIAGTSLIFFPLVIIWFLGAKWTWKEYPPQWGITEKAFGIFLGLGVLSALTGLDPTHSFKKLEKDFYIFIAVLVVALARDRASVFQCLKLFLIAGMITAVLGVLQYASGLDQIDSHVRSFTQMPGCFAHWPEPILRQLSLLRGRAAGTRSHPLTYAECLLFVFAWTLAGLTQPGRRDVWRWGVGAVTIGLAMIASLSRGPWIAAILMFGLCLLIRFSTGALLKLLWVAVPCIGLLSVPALRHRFLSIADMQHHSNAERLHMWSVGRLLWHQHPWLGIGPGNVRIAAIPYENSEEGSNGGWGHLHSDYVNLAVERGGLGLLTFFIFIGTMLYEMIRAYRDSEGDDFSRSVYLASGLGIVGFLVSGFTETNYNDTTVLMVFYLMNGFALALARRRQVHAAH
jgi:O-antigen ligase